MPMKGVDGKSAPAVGASMTLAASSIASSIEMRKAVVAVLAMRVPASSPRGIGHDPIISDRAFCSSHACVNTALMDSLAATCHAAKSE